MTAGTELDLFAQQSFGKAALKKLGPVADNFRLFSAGWLTDTTENSDVMQVKGAEFRAAKTGPNKGELSIMIKGSERMVYVSKLEMAEFED